MTKQTVLFGGFVRGGSGSCVLGDTWVWDGPEETWTQHHPVTSPPPRYGHAMAYGPGGLVLFGGYNGLHDLDETWTWDGTNWERRVSAEAPSARSRTAMAYDEERHQTVLFGGDHEGAVLGDTWTWDGTGWGRRTWPTLPPPRGYAAMAYHPPTKEVLLRGGWNGHGLSDTWAWDGAGWTLRAEHNGQFEADDDSSHSGVMSHHRGSGLTVFQAGSSGTFVDEDDERLEDPPNGTTDGAWVGSGWRAGVGCTRSIATNVDAVLLPGQVGVNCTDAPSRVWAVMAEDSSGALVLFGGYDGDGTDKGDTWTFAYRNSVLSPLDPALDLIPPIPEVDGANHITLSLERPEIPADGTTTITATATVTNFTSRESGQQLNGFAVQFGVDGDTTVSPTTWVPVDANGRATATLTASKTLGVSTINATGQWRPLTGSSGGGAPLRTVECQADCWSETAKATLSQYGMSLAFMPPSIEPDGRATSRAVATLNNKLGVVDERVCFETDGDVSFRSPNGNCAVWTTDRNWEITVVASRTSGAETITVTAQKSGLSTSALLDEGGRSWIEAVAGPSPGREYAAMAFDEASGLTVLFGGYDSAEHRFWNPGEPLGPSRVVGDTWVWNGSTWSRLTTPDGADIPGPSAREGAAMAYDASSSRLVLFGGHDGTKYLNDTWAFDGRTRTWAQLHPVTSPSPRYVANMASDGTGLVMFSGTDGWAYTPAGPTDSNGTGHLRDTWTWHHGQWTEQHPGLVPTPAPVSPPARFANPQPVVVPLPPPAPGCPGVQCPPDAANPYPSPISVAGLSGVVADVKVTLNGLTWPKGATPDDSNGPADADIMVVAPDGHAVMVMSDACGDAASPRPIVSPVTLTFDDSTPARLPAGTGAACTSGRYRPTDIETGEATPFHRPDAFPAPAPVGTNSSTLGDLRGVDPNGTWSLYVVDDGPNDVNPAGEAGRISGGWGIEITTTEGAAAPPSPAASPPPRGRASMAYHPPSGKVLMFGGTQEHQFGAFLDGTPSTFSSPFHPLADTWAWDPATGTWEQQGSGGHPGARRSAAMAYQPRTGHLMLFGGFSSALGRVADPVGCVHGHNDPCVQDSSPLNDTWTWDGRAWAPQSPVMPPPGDFLAGMATDSTGHSVLVSGLGAASHTYVWKPRVALRLDRAAVRADGTSTVQAVATVTDTDGNPLPGLDALGLVTDGDVTLTEVTDRGDGTYGATLTASRTWGLEVLTVKTPVGWAVATLDEVGDACSSPLAASAPGAWTADGVIADMPDIRAELGSALGGDGRIYVSGGKGDSFDAYDPCTNSWKSLPTMPSGARSASAVAAGGNGEIYVIGGYYGDYFAVDRVDLYTPGRGDQPGRWSTLASLPAPKASASAAVDGEGNVVVTGGMFNSAWDVNHSFSTVDSYSPRTGRWTPLPAMPETRYTHASALGPDGRIFVIGGFNGPMPNHRDNSVAAYNRQTGNWELVTPMSNPRMRLAAATGNDGGIYATGGLGAQGGFTNPVGDDGQLDSVEAYVSCTGRWVEVAPMPSSRQYHAALVTSPDGRIYVLGGSRRSVNAYTPGPETTRDCPRAAIDDVNVQEDAVAPATARFAITLDRSPLRPTTVSFRTGNRSATAGSDYVAASGTVEFAIGETAKTIEVTVNGDTVAEGDETFEVKLSAPAAVAGMDKAVGVATIVDAPLPRLSIGDATVAESFSGSTPASLTLTLSEAPRTAVSVNYTTADGSAAAGSDYAVTTGRLDIPAGSTSAAIAVPVLGDSAAEDTETFSVTLSDPTGASLASARGTVAILNAVGGLSVGDASVAEGNAGVITAIFTVTLAGPTGGTVSVDYITTDGSATAGADYTAASGTLHLEVSEQSDTVAVEVTGDTALEGTERFALALSNPNGAPLARPVGSGTIVDDDYEASAAPEPDSAPEPGPQSTARPRPGGPADGGSPAELPPAVTPVAAAAGVVPVASSASEPQPRLKAPSPGSPQLASSPLNQAQAQQQVQQQAQQQPHTQQQAQAQQQPHTQQQAQASVQAGMMSERQRQNELESAQAMLRDGGTQTHLASARRRTPPGAGVLAWAAALLATTAGLVLRPGSSHSHCLQPAQLLYKKRRRVRTDPPRRGAGVPRLERGTYADVRNI